MRKTSGGFGWGAAMGDLNLDGWQDLVQVNGMVDDSLDRRFLKPRNYWYAAEKVMLAPPEVHSYVEYNRLLGDAAASPLVTLRGSPNQMNVGAGASYSFDVRLQ